MYAEFTDRARRAMQIANQEALRLNHEYLGTEHILFGILKEDKGLGYVALSRICDPAKILHELRKHLILGSDMVTMGKLPHTPAAKRAIENAISESNDLHNNYIGTEHLLLGILRSQDGDASIVLREFGVKIEDARREIVGMTLGEKNVAHATTSMTHNMRATLAHGISTDNAVEFRITCDLCSSSEARIAALKQIESLVSKEIERLQKGLA